MADNDPERVLAGAPEGPGVENHAIGTKVLDAFDLLVNTVPGSPLERQSLAELTQALDQYDLSADLDFVLNGMKAGKWRG